MHGSKYEFHSPCYLVWNRVKKAYGLFCLTVRYPRNRMLFVKLNSAHDYFTFNVYINLADIAD